MTTDAYYAQQFISGKGLPHERTAITAWCRALYTLDPMVNSIISSHAALPMNYFSIEYPEDSKANEIFSRQVDELQLTSIISQMLLEYWIIGEAFTYQEIDERKGMIGKVIIQNPDYVVIKKSVVGEPEYFLRPDENLRRIALSDKKEDESARKLLSVDIISNIQRGDNIKLDAFHFGHIVRKVSPYEIRGTSFLVPLISTFIDNIDSDKDLIATCLMDPKSLAASTLERAFSEHNHILSAIKQWLDRKIFAPVAKIHGLYQEKDGVKTLVMPRAKFDREAIRKALGIV